MIDSTNPRIIADSIRHLSGEVGSQGDAIEALGFYSNDEADTGKKWIDGKAIYRKIISIEHMPDADTITIPHGITNLETIIDCHGIMQPAAGTPGRFFPQGANPALLVSSVNLFVGTTSNFSGNSGFVIIEYTKSASPSPDLSSAPNDSRSIEPEVREETPEEEPIEAEPIEEPVVEVKKTTRKKTTTE